MDVVLWTTIATTIVIGLIIALIFRPTSGKVNKPLQMNKMIVLQCSNMRISIETIYYLYWCLGKKSTTSGEGTENEDSVNRQGTGDQGVRRRAANQNRGLRAQLQASRRARLARINEDEQDGMLIRIYIAIFCILNDVITVTRSLVLDLMATI